MDRYVIAVKREARDRVSSDWTDQLRQIEGLEVKGAAGGQHAVIEATPAAIEQVRHRFSDMCHIEPEILHYTSRAPQP